MACIYALVTIAIMLAMFLPAAEDYVGADNDDVMRLVQVRDLLAGQGWFDLRQYRLGLGDGTLMHWSRLVDLPLAVFLGIGATFLPQEQAESIVLTIWPLLLIPLLLYPIGLSAMRLAGPAAMHVALGLSSLFAFTNIRFHPGSIDHHNVQLVLAAWIAAMLIDPERRVTSHVIAGIAAALAVAVGAETVPFVAAACVGVAARWIWQGQVAARAARAFGLAFALMISAMFFLTVPPSHYTTVTCDNLSLGFYALSATGGGLLAVATAVPRIHSIRSRLAAAAVIATAVFFTARIIAPQCLGSPLSDLDPMLVTLWLEAVTEAQSFSDLLRSEPHTLGGYYAVGFFAISVCLFQVVQGEKPEAHLVLLLLLAVSWMIALLQVRGFFFVNLLAILPLSLLIADLRLGSQADPESPNAAFAYVVTVLVSVPAVWALSGALIAKGTEDTMGMETITQDSGARPERGECSATDSLRVLAAQETGVVAGPSNSGAEILRFTKHRVLAAPYHRNQGGMLTELHIGLAPPDEAEAFLSGAGVSFIAFCKNDPQTQSLIRMKPDGLYAALARGEVPPYLQPLGSSQDGFTFYRVTESLKKN
ncbi:hypothetical protein [Rhizobium halophilum]|uniref:hypothetical protein n=1 Tax=Rhizobium halophilum TaxID=2846852 RepID=UPI001EFE6353|nr:hypothetical protein [Rhizobium halophilum]MCF6369309.1 hypothetical protein [Rhizobium halophilum]